MSELSVNGSGRRVVITGLGAVTPLGNDVESSWASLLAGECGAREITLFDHSDYHVHFACELKDFDPTTWIDRKAARRMDRFAQMILAARAIAEHDRRAGLRELAGDRASDPARGAGDERVLSLE